MNTIIAQVELYITTNNYNHKYTCYEVKVYKLLQTLKTTQIIYA